MKKRVVCVDNSGAEHWLKVGEVLNVVGEVCGYTGGEATDYKLEGVELCFRKNRFADVLKVRVTHATSDNWYQVGDEYEIVHKLKTSRPTGGQYYPLLCDENLGLGEGHFKVVVEGEPDEQSDSNTLHIANGSSIEFKEYNKYSREIRKGVFVDVYDILRAFNVTDPCLQHLLKKALAAGCRGHKSTKEDLQDILASAKRALELYEEWEGREEEF